MKNLPKATGRVDILLRYYYGTKAKPNKIKEKWKKEIMNLTISSPGDVLRFDVSCSWTWNFEV